MIVTDGLTKHYGAHVRRRRPQLLGHPRRRHRLPRAERIRQVHDHADDHGPRRARRRPRPGQRRPLPRAALAPARGGRAARRQGRSTPAGAPATTCARLALTNEIPRRPHRRGARHRRADRGGGPAGREVLARHGPAPRHRRRAARGPRRAPLRRADQRPRPRGHPLGPPPLARSRRRGPDRPGLEPPDQRDGADGRAARRHRPRHAHRRDQCRRVHRAATAKTPCGSSRRRRSASCPHFGPGGARPSGRRRRRHRGQGPVLLRPSASWPPTRPSPCTSSPRCAPRSRTSSWSSPSDSVEYRLASDPGHPAGAARRWPDERTDHHDHRRAHRHAPLAAGTAPCHAAPSGPS